MKTKHENLFLKATLLSVVLSLFLLLTTPVFAHEVTWDIIYQTEEPFISPGFFRGGLSISLPISLSVSGTLRVMGPTLDSTVTIPENDVSFSYILPMPETGKHVIRETYTLVFSSQDVIPILEYFTKTDEWEYDNSIPSLMEFQLEDMNVDNYSVSITPTGMIEVVSIIPSPARPGDTGQMNIRTIRDIQEDEEFEVMFAAEWHKNSSLTPVPDNVPPNISHIPVQSIPVGFPIAAKITDNLKVDSAILYFRDASSRGFQLIPMIPTGEPDIYEGYIPITTEGGNGSYYFKATDPSGNETIFPSAESPYNITVQMVIDIEFRKGWNLFSICLEVEENSVSSVLDQLDYESVWTLGSSKQYFPDDPDFPGGLDAIVHGKGYWIDMRTDDTLTITGERLDNTEIWLEEGWNLVGYNYLKEIDVEDAQLFSPGDNTFICTYEEGVWKKYHAGDPSSLNDLDRLKPGKGYYIYVTAGREWFISP